MTMDPQVKSVMDELAALHAMGTDDSKKNPAKKKVKRKGDFKKFAKTMGGVKVKFGAIAAANAAPREEPDHEFEYNWKRCACGLQHPPVPSFKPPDGKRCTYYWQVADMFPFMTIHRALTTEIKFMRADVDHSGVIELHELNSLLKSVIGEKISENMIEKTFKAIDVDNSGTLDFCEVLGVVDTLIQRQENNLPYIIQKEYSKVCSIQ